MLLLLIILILGTVYVLTLLPGVGYSGDTAKWQFVGHVLGTPHTTGYPTYTILNHLFTRFFPLGSIAYRANLLSAVFAVAACCVLYLILLLFDCGKIVSFFGTLIFGFTRTFWSQAVVAEVYTLNLLFVALLFYFLFRWRISKRRRFLLAACAVYAISFGNHMTMVTLLPAVFYFVYAMDRTVFKDRGLVIPIALLILAGALQYSYLIWRFYSPNVPYLEIQTPNLQRFWAAVSGAGFKRKMFVFGPTQIFLERIPMYGRLLIREFYFLLPIAALGAFSVKERFVHYFFLIAFAGSWIYSLNYDIPDIEVYFIPGYFILTFYVAFGLRAIPILRRSAAAAILVCSLLCGFLVWRNLPVVNQRENTLEAKEAEMVFDQLDNDSVVIANYKFSQFLWYFMLEQNPQHKNLYIVRVFDPDEIKSYLAQEDTLYVKEMRKEVLYGHPVYCTTPHQKNALQEEGLQIRKIGANLYHVTLPATGMS
jgi:hypothetical protein